MSKKTEEQTGLYLLRKPFESHQISKLPKPTKQQTEEVKADYKKGIRCKLCGGWHHPDVVHLDYVGHAALTDRLLDADPNWYWEPLSFNAEGLPAFDKEGGLWIKLTVSGHTRIGYGHPDGKSGGDAIKEAIGDALRNAAMRFGAALDLWHKGDLHLHEKEDGNAFENKKVDPVKATEGFKAEQKVANVEDYVMPVGNTKVKGKKLRDINKDDLKSTLDYFKSKGELTGAVKIAVHNAEIYLKTIKTIEPKLDESEELPF